MCDYAQAMIGIFSEVLRGNITPKVANAAIQAGARAMHCVELELRYGAEFERVFDKQINRTVSVATAVGKRKNVCRKS